MTPDEPGEDLCESPPSRHFADEEDGVLLQQIRDKVTARDDPTKIEALVRAYRVRQLMRMLRMGRR